MRTCLRRLHSKVFRPQNATMGPPKLASRSATPEPTPTNHPVRRRSFFAVALISQQHSQMKETWTQYHAQVSKQTYYFVYLSTRVRLRRMHAVHACSTYVPVLQRPYCVIIVWPYPDIDTYTKCIHVCHTGSYIAHWHQPSYSCAM